MPAAPGERSAHDVEIAAQILVRIAFERAMQMLVAHRDLLETGAVMLLEREALESEDLARLFGPRPGMSRLAPVTETA